MSPTEQELLDSGLCPRCSDARAGTFRPLFFRVDCTTNGRVVEECPACSYRSVVGEGS